MRTPLKLSLLLLLFVNITFVSAQNNEQGVRSFFSIIYGKDLPYTGNYNLAIGNKHALGLGLRTTFPFIPTTYLGFVFDGTFSNVGYTYEGTASIGFSLDIKLMYDFFFATDYGLASYSDQFDQSYYGTFWDAGLHWWPSNFIDLGAMFRQHDVGRYNTPTIKNYNSELRFSFNMRLSELMWASIVNGTIRGLFSRN